MVVQYFRLFALFFFLVMTLTSSSALARSWEKVVIPDTRCGDGQPYAVWVDRRNPSKVLFYFEGGGACWDYDSCYGKLAIETSSLGKSPSGMGGFFSDKKSMRSPTRDYTVFYLPYCTNDVLTGTHSAVYEKGRRQRTMHHWGAINTQRALRYAYEQQVLDYPAIEHALVYGYSAGAIGAMIHLREVDRYLPATVRTKVALWDAPGLHFAKTFWKKFTPSLREDISRSMASVGIPYHERDGLLARHIGTVCKELADWRIGILQGSDDVVMSAYFSYLFPPAHRKKVLGPSGVFEKTKDPSDNCSAWVPTSPMHTFLFLPWSVDFKAGGKTARRFATELIHGGGGQSYRD